mgnify:CR=1 FL=1
MHFLSLSAQWLCMMRTEIFFVYSTDQSAHQTLHECSLLLGTDRVKVQNALVGGGFGGKEDMTVQHLAALLTYATKETGEDETDQSRIPAGSSEASFRFIWI